MSSPKPDAVRFLLDGEKVEVSGLPATTTVLDWLRVHAGRSGTKEGCAEGDCGACTVVLGERHGDRIDYRAINSCIRFLPTIDGRELVTVESLSASTNSLHPVQQSMVDHHASQCGFCTPGFVMSLFALYQQREHPSRDTVLDTLSGNLCRCTGYRPIIDAALHVDDYPTPERWNRHDAQAPSRVAALRGLHRDTALRLPGFIAPRSLAELATEFAANPDALLLAGGTDVGLWATKQLRELPKIIYLGEVSELHQVQVTEAGVDIGAAVTHSTAWPLLVTQHPALVELARRFASPLVCNSATLCGNIANGSPIGDAMPALIALGAELTLVRGDESRRIALDQFYLGYQKKDLQPGEFVASVHVPSAKPRSHFASYKLSKRTDQDISAVCAAFAVQVTNGHVTDARIAFGGMAAVPARAPMTEAALIGKPWNLATVESATAAIASDFQPLSDLRASSAYRLTTAANLMKRFWLEQQPQQPVIRLADLVP